MNTTVAAIVVTHNRKLLVSECLGALLNQTYPLQRILIIDNGSADGTYQYLRSLGLMDSPIVRYVRVENNCGGAGGFHIGIEEGIQEGYDWLWVMDDDAEPQRDAVEQLAKHFKTLDHCSALACLVVDQNGRMIRNHYGRLNNSNPFAALVKPFELLESAQYVEVDHASFVGLCLRSDAISKAGYPDERFFIHLDDLEYCQRMRRHGKIFLIPSSRIIHKEASKQDQYIEKKIGFLRSRRVRYERLWMQYFVRRNSVYFVKRHAKSQLTFWAWLIFTIVRSSAAILVFDDFKRKRLNFVMHSIYDGIVGRFDNEKPKRLLY